MIYRQGGYELAIQKTDQNQKKKERKNKKRSVPEYYMSREEHLS